MNLYTEFSKLPGFAKLSSAERASLLDLSKGVDSEGGFSSAEVAAQLRQIQALPADNQVFVLKSMASLAAVKSADDVASAVNASLGVKAAPTAMVPVMAPMPTAPTAPGMYDRTMSYMKEPVYGTSSFKKGHVALVAAICGGIYLWSKRS
jgi:hypothetical protein